MQIKLYIGINICCKHKQTEIKLPAKYKYWLAWSVAQPDFCFRWGTTTLPFPSSPSFPTFPLPLIFLGAFPLNPCRYRRLMGVLKALPGSDAF